MLPIKLTIQAWGAYPNKVEIPFSKLGDNGIYLISGITGSGKTTIFDAITYALYNQTSGTIRDNSALRSHYAKDDIETFVELEFLFNGEIYKVKRYPAYERKNLKKEGYVKQAAKAEFYYPNSKIIQGSTDVTKAIEDLTGLNINQFCQIALLPQGEFMKLLNSDTQTRCEIFRNIFKTQKFSHFSSSLKEKANNYHKDFEENKNSIIQYISQLKLENVELNEHIKKIIDTKAVELTVFNTFLDTLETNIKTHSKNTSDKQREIELLEDKILKLEKEQQSIELLLNLKEKKNALEAKLNIEKEFFENAKKEFLKIPNFEKDIENTKEQILNLNNDYRKCEELKNLENQASIISKNLFDKVDSFNQNKESMLTLSNEHLSFLISGIKLLKKKVADKQAIFTQKQKEIVTFENKYNALFHEYLAIQAGILAKNLAKNKPCPVCGSKNHPNPAEIKNENLTKEYVDNFRKDLDLKIKNLSTLSKNIEILLKEIEFKNNSFEKTLKQYTDVFSNKISYDNVKSQEKNFEKLIENLSNNNIYLKDEISKLELEKASITALIKKIKKETGELNLNSIKTSLNQAECKIKELQTNIKNIRKNYDEKNIVIKNLSTNIKLITKQISEFNISASDFNKNIQALNETKESYTNLKSIYSVEFATLKQNEELLKLLKNKTTIFTKIEKLYKEYQLLSDIANGNLKGAAKIDFEQYIQGYYLDLVLNEANKHFKIMTKNQYQLLRKQEITSKISKTSLDIEVMDFHTFKTRSTKTLSGGESFKAALSLALGLSDCISSMSGAINIDAMFIDEGFGSLDSESLELAMQVITNLSTTKRLIGIISHVEELKQKIETQIHSIKTDYGSNVILNF